ncbi:partner and localizer of BRCA2 isoform X1 [Hippoglossus hippoglossus]|uniref:partner and localizer of BRCA2 isoform X1 n=1 Tax=Hippoglossus hippoglossus TaxID=8267 RepID=UPI00148E7744|nr:partner and localizer of BRCA2 isoform X1 [Hippoglossus hippoglossus]XP_034455262.1 partner and localizer of BRCA2 isoform X1 [Hippoglossus hippoglossus]
MEGRDVEEQLRTTLHCDDKEKLRRKLALLKREYLRTAQRLQRAERLEGVRRHVRSRISQQNLQDQRDPEETSKPSLCPVTLNTGNATTPDKLQCLGHTEGPADSDNLRRSQVIRFLLPSDADCPQTPDPSHDAVRGHRPSPALRLRSRRSRLLWERRSAEVCRITDNSEEVQEQGDKLESVGTIAGEEKIHSEEAEKIKSEEAEVVIESEELFSSSESDSPSLLLTHWKTHAHTETGDTEGKEIKEEDEQSEKEDEATIDGKKESESTSLLLQCQNSAVQSEESGRDRTPNGEREEGGEGDSGENSRGQRETTLSDESHDKNMEETATEKIETEKMHDGTMEIKEEKSVLDSCTLVEGLLFPVEYYVRTTRRMTSSQSQPDMQAVLLSQLSTGRQRRGRGRGRGRGLNRHTHTSGCSDLNSQEDFSSLTTASIDPHESSHACTVDASAELSANSQRSSEISSKSQNGVDASSSPAVSATHPGAGRRRRGRRRGRGRGRSQTPRSIKCLDIVQMETSVDPQPTLTPLSSSSSPSLHAPDGLKPRLTPQEPVLLSDDDQPVSTCHTGTQPSPGVNGAQCSPASRHLQRVYPMFLMNNTPSQSTRESSWRSLLLPSSPLDQTSLFPLPSPSTGSLFNNLMTFDIHQDFHLPDDQFASLKLHKLRQVAVESGVELYTSPSYNTRSRLPRCYPCYSTSDPVVALPLPLSLTPTVSMEEKPACVDVENLSTDSKLVDESLAEKSSNRDKTETPGEQQTENLDAKTHISSTESVSVAQESPADCEDDTKKQDTVDTQSQSNTHRSRDDSVKPQPYMNCAHGPASKVDGCVVEKSSELKIKQPASEKDSCCSGVVCSVEDQTSTNHRREDRAVIKTLCFDCPPEESAEEASNSRSAAQTCNDTDAPVKHRTSPARHSEESSEPPTHHPRDRSVIETSQKSSPHPSVHSQVLLSPPLTSAHCPFTTPHLASSALLSSPTLPSLGLTPCPVSAGLPLTSSPSAPALTLPPPHSPATHALSPPALSPCPSITSLPPSRPLVSRSSQDRASSQLSAAADRHPSVEPATFATASNLQSRGTGGQEGERLEETAEQHVITHTLKAPAGGCLVDTCCLPGPSGGLCVAAAGKWAVCLWSQTPASDWSLTHTWTFNYRVINVFPVPDAAGLMFVTLGQLEIREVRVLSCSSLTQVLLCEGVVQVVVGVSGSRVVTSSHSATGSTLRVFNVSDDNSARSSQPLESPGVCVGALAPVDGLSDALIGTDEGGRVFVWNLKSGQLLRSIVLGDGLSHTACLRGYSHCGVLFVLLQHQLLSSPEDVGMEAKAKDELFSEEDRKKAALFSLVAVNPLTGKSALATRLYPPKAWSGRLCEADVNRSNVVGLSQSGCVCVWELGRPGASRMVWAPESEGWQLARWGGPDTLVTGHHKGDVTVHCYSRI